MLPKRGGTLGQPHEENALPVEERNEKIIASQGEWFRAIFDEMINYLMVTMQYLLEEVKINKERFYFLVLSAQS